MTVPWIVAFSSLALLVLVIGTAFVGLLRRLEPLILSRAVSPPSSVARMPLDPGGLEPGTQVPSFLALERDGSEVTADTAGRQAAVLLLLRAGCGPCEDVVRSIAISRKHRLRDRVIAVTSSVDEIDPLRLGEAGLRVAVQENNSVFNALGTTATPYAFLIDRRGRVAGSIIPTCADDLDDLVALGAVGDSAQIGGKPLTLTLPS
jgi:hypothetical protein